MLPNQVLDANTTMQVFVAGAAISLQNVELLQLSDLIFDGNSLRMLAPDFSTKDRSMVNVLLSGAAVSSTNVTGLEIDACSLSNNSIRAVGDLGPMPTPLVAIRGAALSFDQCRSLHFSSSLFTASVLSLSSAGPASLSGAAAWINCLSGSTVTLQNASFDANAFILGVNPFRNKPDVTITGAILFVEADVVSLSTSRFVNHLFDSEASSPTIKGGLIKISSSSSTQINEPLFQNNSFLSTASPQIFGALINLVPPGDVTPVLGPQFFACQFLDNSVIMPLGGLTGLVASAVPLWMSGCSFLQQCFHVGHLGSGAIFVDSSTPSLALVIANTTFRDIDFIWGPTLTGGLVFATGAAAEFLLQDVTVETIRLLDAPIEQNKSSHITGGLISSTMNATMLTIDGCSFSDINISFQYDRVVFANGLLFQYSSAPLMVSRSRFQFLAAQFSNPLANIAGFLFHLQYVDQLTVFSCQIADVHVDFTSGSGFFSGMFYLFEGVSSVNVSFSSLVSSTVQGQCTCEGLFFSSAGETSAQVDNIFVSDNAIMCSLISSGLVMNLKSRLYCSNSVFRSCRVHLGAGLFNIKSQSTEIDVQISNCSAYNVSVSTTGPFLTYINFRGLRQSGSFLVQGSNFTDLHAGTTGGAISALTIPIGDFPSFSFLNSSCTGCSSLLGGCLHVISFNAEILGSTFVGNAAVFGEQPAECTLKTQCGEGGALWSQSGEIHIAHSVFESNLADAAAAVVSRFSPGAFIQNSSFEDRKSTRLNSSHSSIS